MTVGTNRLVSTVVTGSVAMVVAIACWQPAAAATELSPCADIAVFAMKGSGQNDKNPKGAGPENDYLIALVKQSVTDLDYADTFAVPYPAESTNTLKPSNTQIARLVTTGGRDLFAIDEWRKTRLNKFLASIDAGVGSLTTAIDLRSRQCPDESLVLTGYSQGASAIHRYLNRLEDAGNSDVLDRVAAVVLIADPDRIANSSAMATGSADAGAQGIAAFRGTGVLKAVRMPGPNRDVPADLAEFTVSVCDRYDIVCDWTPLNIATKWKPGSKTHVSYAGSSAVHDAAQLVVDML